MTTEIAVLNKSAIALAADSAVSIGRGPNTKIFNTVNKIFELSEHHPVGVMIYNRLDFMGLPYETLVKEYRKELGTTSFPSIIGYRDDFLDYLRTRVPVSERDEQQNGAVVLNDIFSAINEELNNAVLDDIKNRGKYLKSKVNGICQKLIRSKIKHLKATPFANGFSKLAMPEQYLSFIDSLIEYSLNDNYPNLTTKDLLSKYGEYFIAKSVFSSFLTGIVFAGFGDRDLCPSLEAIETDGIIAGKLKFRAIQSIDVGRRGPEAEILGFAQDDMVQRFVHGLDPEVKAYFDKANGDSIREAFRQVLIAQGHTASQVSSYMSSLSPVIEEMILKQKQQAEAYVEDTFTSQIKSMVKSMPKQDLATLAESLVEITSLKRKVSRDRETVGGEVDVAIISKSEGFVWKKRKHYFPAELNHRFFARRFPGHTMGI